VTLTASGTGNTFTSPITGTTNAEGVFTTTLSSTAAQDDTFTALIGGTASETATVDFTAGGVSQATSSLTASPSTVAADGTSTTTLTVVAEDAHGNVIPDATVTLTASGTGNTFTSPITGTTNAEGVFTTTLSSTAAQDDTFTVVVNGTTVNETATVDFTPALSLTAAVIDNLAVQEGQTLVATATIADSAYSSATISYQWQSLINGVWTDVGGALAGNFNNGQPSSFLQLTEADEALEFRVQASFTNSSGQVVTATSAGTTPVADVTPLITPTFNYAVDDLSIVKNGTEIYNNAFAQAPPVSSTILNTSGVASSVVFVTLGSTWTEGLNNQGQAAAVLSSTGVAQSPVIANTDQVFAALATNTDPTNTTAGLKEGAAFTISATFDLTDSPYGNYGLQLNNGTQTHTSDQIVSLFVQSGSNGSTIVSLIDSDAASGTSSVLASQTLTAQQLASSNQIDLQLSHAANTTAITGTFELLDNGTVTSSPTTFTPTGTMFANNENWAQADIGAFVSSGVGLNVGAGEPVQVGQTLRASATTNDADATINYQWEESSSSSFSTFTDIGSNAANYTVQRTDIGDYIRVIATTSDADNPQSATATSVVTGAVQSSGPTVDDWTGNAADGQWSTTGNWDAGVPTTNSEVQITISDAIVTFDSSSPDTIDTLTTNGGTTLDVASGAMTISGADGRSNVAGSLGIGGSLDIQNSALALGGSVTVSGLIEATDHGTLDIQTGTIDNSGTGGNGIAIDGTSTLLLDSNAFVQIGDNFFINVVELSGGGDVAMASGSQITENADNESIVASGAVLYNVDNDVFGAGTIGTADGHLDLYNAADGTIDADLNGQALTLDTGNRIHNAGHLEATSGGILQIDDLLDNSGTLEADGGTLRLGAGFTFTSNSANEIVTLADGGTLQLGNTDAFTSSGGTISGFGPNSAVDLSDVAYASGEYAVWTQTGGSGTLAIYSSAGTLEASLNLNGIYAQGEFGLTGDGSTVNSGGPGTDVNFSYIPFADGQINSNGNVTPLISDAGSVLQLTDGSMSEASSWFAATPVSVAAFTASFDYQATGDLVDPGAMADGMAFILQDDPRGSAALGGAGSSLGYSTDPNANGITPSAALEFNVYVGHTQGTNFVTDDSTGIYNSTSPVDFWDTGDQIQVVVSYDGGTLTETLTDLVNGNTYSTSYDNVDLSQILGSSTAYVGFSAATGGGVSTQTVSDFTFTAEAASPPSPPVVSFNPTYLTFSGDGQSAVGAPPSTQTDNVTIAGWINWHGDNATGSQEVLFYNGTTSADGYGLIVAPTAGGLDVQGLAGSQAVLDGNTSLSANQWYFVTLTRADGTFHLYVDGVEQTDLTHADSGVVAIGAGDQIQIGGSGAFDDPEIFSGSIGDVSVWDTALTQSQIQALQGTYLSGNELGLAGYYPLSDGSGAVATDSVNSTGSLTLSGNPTWVVDGGTSWSATGGDVVENSSATLIGLDVSSVNAGDTLAVTLDVGHGTLTLGSTSGLSIIDGNDGGHGTLEFTGSLSDVDTALESGLTYTPTAGFTGPDTLTFAASDGGIASNPDTLTITVVTPPTPVIVNTVLQDGSFETPDLGVGNFEYGPTAAPWTFSGGDSNSGGDGIANNGSGFTSANPSAPDGDQVAFLQSREGSSGQTISQTFDAAAGTYTLDFDPAQRGNGSVDGLDQNFEVLVDGNVVGTFEPQSTTYAAFSASVDLTSAGEHTLTFEALNSNGSEDATDLIDAVALVANDVTTTESTALTLSNLSISSVNTNDTITVTLSVNDGTLSLGGITGLTIVDGNDGSAGTLEFTGLLGDVNTGLASGLTYTPTSGFAGNDTLSFTASDSGATSTPENLIINVAPSAAPPVDTWNGAADGFFWSTPGNWSGGFPPAADEQAAVAGGDNPFITSNVTFDNVTLDNGGTQGATISVVSGAILTLLDNTVISNGALSTDNQSTVDIEVGSLGFGSGASMDALSVSNGSVMDVGTTTSGALLMLDDNASITSGTLAIGNAETGGGTIDVETGQFGSGATFSSVNANVYGALDVGDQGSNAIFTLDDGVTVFGFGAGTMTVGATDQVAIEGHLNNDGATFDDLSVNLQNNDSGKGTIQVDGVQSPVTLTLTDGTTLSGGELSIGSSGEVDVAFSDNISPDAVFTGGLAVVNAGELKIEGDATLALGSSLTLSGGGEVVLENGSRIAEVSTGTFVTLDNVDNDISGAGTIGNHDRSVTLNNDVNGTIDANVSGATLTIDTANDEGDSSKLTNAGTLKAENGGELSVHSNVDDTGGLVFASGGFVDFELGVTGGGTGTAEISDDGKIEYGWTSDLDTLFSGFGALVLDHQAQKYTGLISGFSSGDTIDLTDLVYKSTETTTWNAAIGTLTINNGASSAALSLNGTYNQDSFAFTSDGSGNTEVVSDPTTLTLSGLNGSGNAAAGQKVTATIGNGTLANITYTWLVGGAVAQTGTSNTFTPTAAAAGLALDVIASFTDPINSAQTDAVTATAGTVTQLPQLWGEQQFPTVVQGEHLFGVNPQYNAAFGVVALAYSDASNYSTTESSVTMTRNAASLDPFFLPDPHAPQLLHTDTVDAPARYNLILPTISFSGTDSPEGIYVYKGQLNSDGTGGNVIWQVIVTPDSNGDGGVTAGSPTEIGTSATTGETIYNVIESFKNNIASTPTAVSFDVVWDQYNSSTNSYNLEVQITPIDQTTGAFGTPTTFVPLITESGGASVTVATTALPAWAFRPAGSSSGNVAYALAIAETDTTRSVPLNLTGTHQAVHFQDYTATGSTLGVGVANFIIQPDLIAYASGATNQIVQPIVSGLSPYPGQVAQALQFVQVSSSNAGDYAVAWNETVTNAAGTVVLGDQVEFAVYKPSASTVEFQTAVQIGDGQAQNVRVGEFADPFASGQDDVVIAYGDDTGTHILEYGVTGSGANVSLLANFTDPTTQPFDNMTVMGDGRIAITYNDLVNPSPDETSQYDFRIFDLRTQGLDNPTLSMTQTNYIASTHYSDTITGANNVGNEYYFVGQDSANGTAPSDTFHGGSGGWNIAIFADARSNYTISTQIENGPNITTIASNGDDPAHTGSLAVTNVSFLAFDPASDPAPHNNIIDVSGGTFVILGGNSAVTIENGATAEFDSAASGQTAYAGNITFEGSVGALQVDQLNELTGQIAGIAHGDTNQVLDLQGFGASNNDQFTVTPVLDGNGNTVLSVTDTSLDSQPSESVTLAGDYTGDSWTAADDGHGGVDVFDPPASSSNGNGANGFLPNDEQITFGPNGEVTYTIDSGTTVSAATQTENTTVMNSGPVVGQGAHDTFVFQPGVGAETIANFNPQQDTLSFEHFTQAQTVQELQTLITTDTQGDAVINLGHNDSVTIAGVTTAQLQQAILSGHVLLH
jgi:hypothetical protein